MGIFETLALVAGAGVVMYYGYSIVLSKLNQQQQLPLPPPVIIPAPTAAPVPYSAPATTNTIKEPTKEKPKPTPSSNKQKEEGPENPILTPTTKDMTSPNVAGSAFTFNVVGDLDDNALAAATAKNLCGDNPTLTMIIGDFAYHNDAQKWWTGSMKACNGKNNLGSVGNHDNKGQGFLELFPLNKGKWEFIYKVGNIAFIAVNTGFCGERCMDLKSETLFQQAQADPSVKFIVVHFHKPIFTTGTAPDAPMELHNMMKKYPKVKMAFAGHNHSYRRYTLQDGIQYITAGAGGHDKTASTAVTKGPSSGSVGVVKCRVATDGSMTCQYVANNGTILDQWGLTAAGKHTGSGGVPPKQGTAPSESGYAQAFFTQLDPYNRLGKEERDNAFLSMMDRRNAILYPPRKLNNTIYHYSTTSRIRN